MSHQHTRSASSNSLNATPNRTVSTSASHGSFAALQQSATGSPLGPRHGKFHKQQLKRQLREFYGLNNQQQQEASNNHQDGSVSSPMSSPMAPGDQASVHSRASSIDYNPNANDDLTSSNSSQGGAHLHRAGSASKIHTRTRSTASTLSSVSEHSSTQQQQQPHVLDFASPNFDAEAYLSRLLQSSSLTALLKTTKSISHQIQHLDTNLQKLVYENYNKFLRATSVVKEMRGCVSEMEGEMMHLEQRMQHMMHSASKIEEALSERTSNIQRLSAISLMLKKMQFILDLPQRLAQCLELETYPVAVKYYHVGSVMLDQWRSQLRRNAEQQDGASDRTATTTMDSFEKIWQDTEEMVEKLKDKVRTKITQHYQTLKEIREHEAKKLLERESTTSADDTTEQSDSADTPKTAQESTTTENDENGGLPPLDIVYRELKEQLLLLLQLNDPLSNLRKEFFEQHKKYVFDPILSEFEYREKNTISENLFFLNEQFFSYYERFYELFDDVFMNEENRRVEGVSPRNPQSDIQAPEHSKEMSHSQLVTFTNTVFERYFVHVHDILVTQYKLSTENSPQNEVHNDNMTRNLFEAWEYMAIAIKPMIRLLASSKKQFEVPPSPGMGASPGAQTSFNVRAGAKRELKNAVFHFIQHNREVLEQKLASSIETLSTYKVRRIGGKSQQDSSSDQEEESVLKQMAQKEAGHLNSLISQFTMHFRQFIDAKEPLIKSSISLFKDRLFSNVFALLEHFCNSTLRNSCSTYSQVHLLDEDIRPKTTASGALILSCLCHILSTKSLRQVEKILTEHFGTSSAGKSKSSSSGYGSSEHASRSRSSSNNQQLAQYQESFHQLRTSLQKQSRDFILFYIESQGLRLSELVKLGMETPQWEEYDVVREVRHMTTAIVQDMEEISNELEALFPDEFNQSVSSTDSKSVVSKSKSSLAYGKQSTASSLGGSLAAGGHRHHRSGSGVHDFMNVLESDVMKIFNKRLSSFKIRAPESQEEVARSFILFEICKIVLKTLEESIRVQMFNKNGFQQMQVDIAFLSRKWQTLFQEQSQELQTRLQSALQSAAENTIPSASFEALEESIVDKIVGAQFE